MVVDEVGRSAAVLLCYKESHLEVGGQRIQLLTPHELGINAEKILNGVFVS